MKKFKFKDGSIITASCAEEAKAKHKVMAVNKKEIWEKGMDISKFRDSIKKVLSSLGLSYTEVAFGDFDVNTPFGKIMIEFDRYRDNVKVHWKSIYSKIYNKNKDIFYSTKISNSKSSSKIKEMIEDVIKLAELNKKVRNKYVFVSMFD